mgnify:CR=1 FL=1
MKARTRGRGALTEAVRARLVEAAQGARQRAYAPYSHYRVGAALLGQSGAVYTGCNVENASYGASICAERTAAVKAISEGERTFVAIAVVTANGGTPCGICRQFLSEFAPDLRVIIADAEGRVHSESALADLLPDSLGTAKLPAPPCSLAEAGS